MRTQKNRQRVDGERSSRQRKKRRLERRQGGLVLAPCGRGSKVVSGSCARRRTAVTLPEDRRAIDRRGGEVRDQQSIEGWLSA